MPSMLISPTRHDVYPFIDPAVRLAGAADGKTVLIAGTGTCIERAIALAFALAGASAITIAAPKLEFLEEVKARIDSLVGKRCRVVVVGCIDVTDDSCATLLFDTVTQQVGQPPDIVVSNATAVDKVESFQEIDPFTWWTAVDVNLRGTYLIARNYFAALRSAGKAQALIIVICSHAPNTYSPNTAAYSIPRAALTRFYDYTKSESSGADMPETESIVMRPGNTNELLRGKASVDGESTAIDKSELAGATAVYLTTKRADFLRGRFLDASWDMEELEKLKPTLEDQNLLRIRAK